MRHHRSAKTFTIALFIMVRREREKKGGKEGGERERDENNPNNLHWLNEF